MIHFKVVTTKQTFITRDVRAILKVKQYNSVNNYGKKMTLPTFRDVHIMVNPQYIVLVEQLEDDGKTYPSLDDSPIETKSDFIMKQ